MQILARLPRRARVDGPGVADAGATGLTPSERRGLVEVVTRAGHVAQCQIAALRLRHDTPDFLLTVPVPRVGIFEFQRSAELIEAGRSAAERLLPGLRVALERAEPVRHRIRRWLAPVERHAEPAEPRRNQTG